MRDSVTWGQVWTRATRSHEARPHVDFARNMVLVASSGWSIGDEIRIDSLRVRGQDIVAVVWTMRFCSPAMREAAPVDMVLVPRTRGKVRWVERANRLNCQG